MSSTAPRVTRCVKDLARAIAAANDPVTISCVKALAKTLAEAGLKPQLNAASRGGHPVRLEREESIRTALIDDIAPVLSSLRNLIEAPTKSTLLSLAVNLGDIERAVLANESSDAAWLDYLTSEMIAGFATLSPSHSAPEVNAIDITATTRMSDALRNAAARGVMPTHLDTEGLRELDASLRAASFFSARTASAGYVSALKKLVERHIQGEGYNNDLPQLRVEARELLQAYGYTPEKGFPGDSRLGVPPADPGSLRDLGSERRLNLIFNTQAALMRGLGQKLRGLDRIDSHPCWELVRVQPRRHERDWLNRWTEAGGPFLDTAISRLIAPKDAEIWSVIGDSAIFDDALDVDHPPFAFESGMGWREVSFTEATELGMVIRPQNPGEAVNNAARESATRTPPADNFIGGQATLDSLEARLREIQRRDPLDMDSILQASREANQR